MQTQDKVLPVDIGIETKTANKLPKTFSSASRHLFAVSQTHYFHWNVTGSLFHSLHQMFEEQYTELAMAVTIAERIRSLGYFAWVLQRVYRIKLNQRDAGSTAEDMVLTHPR